MTIPPVAAEEVSSDSTLDFSTSGQSMWGSGAAAEYSNTWTLAGFDTGLHSGSILDGALGYQFQLAAALQAQLTASTGSISLDYPLDASFNNPNLAAPGQQFTIDTTPNGLNTANPTFDGTLPQITAGLQAQFSGVALLNYDIFGDSGSVGVQPFDTTIPLVTVTSGQQFTIPPLQDEEDDDENGKGEDSTSGGNGGEGDKGGDGGDSNSPFSLTFALPDNYLDQSVSVGNEALPTETLTADTDNVIAGNVDLLQLAANLIFGPEVPFPSGDIGPISYDIASLTLSAGVGLAQQFTFVPTDVTADITAPWGQSDDVELGQDATFTVPDTWTAPIDLTTQYMLGGDLVSQAGIIGHLDLGVSLLSGSLGPFDFGPLYSNSFPLVSTDPIYLATVGGSNGFALQGFNSISGGLSIGLGTGKVTLPGSTTIDTTAFTANSTAVIQTFLMTAAGSDTATNIYDPVTKTGNATTVAGKLNVEAIDPTSTGSYTLPTGFLAGIVEPGTGNVRLTGNSSDVLLAAAPGAGETDTLISGGNDALVGGQDGHVNFVLKSGFGGEIVGLTAGDTVELQGVAFDKSGAVRLGPDNVLSVSEGGKTYNIQLHQTEDFSNTFFLLGGTAAYSLITIKARPVAPSALALAAASDSGVKGDDITNVTKPTITGSGAAGDTVSLYDGTTLLGTAKVGSTGSWSIKLAKALSEGQHAFTATETDSSHVVSNPSQALALTIDTTPPAAPTGLLLDAKSDTGKKGDDITSGTTPTIDGKGTPGDTITLLQNGKSLGTATVSGAGAWSVTSSALPIGKHTLTATDTDAAGNVSGAVTPALALTIAPPPIGPTAANQPFYFGTNNQYVLGTTGSDYIWGNSNGSLIDGLGGNDMLGVGGNNDTIDSGDGNDTLTEIGNNDVLIGGTGNDFMTATGNGDRLTGGTGNDTLIAIGTNDTLQGGTGNELLMLTGTGGTVHTGFAQDTIFALSGDDTITGNGENTIYLGGGHNTLLDASGLHHDTVTGFSQAGSDRIHLTTDTAAHAVAHQTQVNNGLDTLITLSDGSTITLKFVSHVTAGFFA